MKTSQATKRDAGAQPARRKGRWVPYVILLGTALPVIAAYLLHHYASLWQPGAQTVNRGVLISPPLNIQKFQLVDQAGQPLFKGEFPGKWLILQLTVDECSERCMVRRHELRQVHVALGKEMGRVNRLLVQEQEGWPASEAQQVNEGEPPLQLARGNLSELRRHLEQAEMLKDHVLSELVFLVDPLGNVMMYYTPTSSGKDLLKDLRKLLKASQIG